MNASACPPRAPARARVAVTALVCALAAAALLAGCGSDKHTQPIVKKGPTVPPNTPLNDSPVHTMARFQAAYQWQDTTQYRILFTADFLYTFSSQTDPVLAQQYSGGNGWNKHDESEAAGHLLSGFTDSHGVFQPAAGNIAIAFVGDQYLQDPAHADSARHYGYVPVANVNLMIDIPQVSGDQTFQIFQPHAFYLVRGDAAILDAGQPADSLHWYIRRWEDQSVSFAGGTIQLASGSGGTPTPTTPATWGKVKSQYLH